MGLLTLLSDLSKILSIRAYLYRCTPCCNIQCACFNFPWAVIKCSSVVHVIRIHAIYDNRRAVLYCLGALYGAQIVVTAICCAFYRCALLLTKMSSTTLTCCSAVPLEQGQGCIAGPKAAWVGIYWVVPTLLYTASVGPMT